MSRTLLPLHSDISACFPRPVLFIKTLGTLEALYHGSSVIWKGGGAGRHQLQRLLAYLVVYCGRTVPNRSLVAAAGQRDGYLERPTYVISGICQFLKRHGLQRAYHRTRHDLRLQSDERWKTDTDALQAGHEQAERLVRMGDRTGAITVLDMLVSDEHIALGQEYLVDLRQQLPHDVHLHAQAVHWRNMQRKAIWLLVDQLLLDPLPDPQQRYRPYQLAQLALGLEQPGAFDYRQAARAASLANLHEMVEFYHQQADAADSGDER